MFSFQSNLCEANKDNQIVHVLKNIQTFKMNDCRNVIGMLQSVSTIAARNHCCSMHSQFIHHPLFWYIKLL